MNRLADEPSPYLQQHADNPVDWFPWGEEAFARAREEDRPVFLSVGYSSCHWCHVMAHESFEDAEIAAELNDKFVNVKVDREERPDVDAVYMQATQALTGRGGWPMSVFLTPDGEPFYAGTYWPREKRHGMASFPEVIAAVHDAWVNRRDEVVDQAAEIAEAIDGRDAPDAADQLDTGVADRAATALVEQAWDRDRGGFGKAPKFPQAMVLSFLLDHHARTGDEDALRCAAHSLEAMARGGIHDQVGGGFHRYSTDERWLVPHFEKMLYDNALLLDAYARAAAATGREDFAAVARRTHAYLRRELQQDGGGFSSATDADSEGEEGRFFVWSHDEFSEVVRQAGADPEPWAAYFDVTPAGNWEGTNVLHRARTVAEVAADHDLEPAALEAERDAVRDALFARREQRVRPGMDDKVLTSWNALLIRALARAGALLDDDGMRADARRTAAFLDEHLWVEGRLHHSFKDGDVGAGAFLEDVALLAAADLALYETTGELARFRRAVRLAEDAIERFHDPAGGYYQTAEDAEELYTRPKETWDNATPSGNSVLAGVFARLAALTGEGRWHDRATEIVQLFQDAMPRMPTGYGELLGVVEHLAAPQREVAVVGPDDERRRALLSRVWERPRPGVVVAPATAQQAAADEVPLLTGRGPVDGVPAAYVCRDFVCEQPVTHPDALEKALARRE